MGNPLSDLFKKEDKTMEEVKNPTKTTEFPPPGNVDPNPIATKTVDNTAAKNEDAQPTEGDKPSDPYVDFQSMGTTEGEVDKLTGKNPDARIYTVNRDYAAEERIKAENMRAKEAEINAPGHFTQDEANRIASGMDPAKRAEIQAQVVDATEDNVNNGKRLVDEVNERISQIMADGSLGRNAIRFNLRNLRQRIQSLETQMDQGRI